MWRALLLTAALTGAGCLQGVDLDQRVFPCRSAADCVEGFLCHPARFVCVAVGTATSTPDSGMVTPARDAQPTDSAAPAGDAQPLDDAGGDAGPAPGDGGPSAGLIGDRCDPAGTERCREGTCVDGVCCKEACDGLCERCDSSPGECTPVTRGRDPADECPDLDCAGLTYGLEANTCYAYRAETRASTCDGARACTRASCADAARGAVLAVCVDLACVANGACPRGAAVADYDSAEELCGGPDQSCASGNLERGCCAPNGRCCAEDLCTENSQRCP